MSVVVLGMHRSGTSVATRVVNLLGVPMCRPADLLRGHAGNERGHWESTSLARENERLLHTLSARWWCPPDSASQAEALAADEVAVERARRTFTASYPTPQWVWKDPRLCLLLPFWRQVLPGRPVALIVYRDPAEVAASLQARNSISIGFGLALWERYVALSFDGSRGMPTMVCSYGSLVADPVAWAERVTRFLTENGIEARMPAVAAGIRAFVTSGLRHTTSPPEITGQLTATQRGWYEHLDALSREQVTPGVTALLPAARPAPESGPEAIEMMRAARVAFGLRAGGPQANGSAEPRRPPVKVLDARPVPRSFPRSLVSVLMLPGGRAASAADVRRLAPRLPADAEIVTVVTPDDVTAGDTSREPPERPELLEVRREESLSLAQRLNLAAEVARGDILVVLAGCPVTPRPGWLPVLRQALQRHENCAVVAPALRARRAAQVAYGLTTDPLLVDIDWHVGDGDRAKAFPVWSASATAFVTTRRHFEAVGGFDGGLVGASREDIDFCLRLWRAGWNCLAVPTSEVLVEFDTPAATELELLTNMLRLGMVHLGPDQLREQIEYLSGCDAFPAALSRVTAGDAGIRRSIVTALSWYRTADLLAAPAPRGMQPTLSGGRDES